MDSIVLVYEPWMLAVFGLSALLWLIRVTYENYRDSKGDNPFREYYDEDRETNHKLPNPPSILRKK